MIHVLAEIHLVPGKREPFLAEFRRLIPAVRGEQGCLEYCPAVDTPTGIASQQPDRPDVVVVIEKWTGLAELKAHLVAPHMQEYRPRVKEYVKETRLFVLEPAE